MLFVGDDWAEDHHDVHLMNDAGERLASRRLPEGLAGMRVFHELVAAHAAEPVQVMIGIETDRGLWVDALTAAGYQVFAVLTTSPGARDFYDQRRAAGDLHHQALRALGNRLVGILHGYLRHHTHYDENKAWAHRQPKAA